MRKLEAKEVLNGWAVSVPGSSWHGLGPTCKAALEDLKGISRRARRNRPGAMAKESGHGRSQPPFSCDDLDELDEIIKAFEASEEGRACISN